MHLRINKIRRGNKTYRYAQLVQSYRRPDGITAQKVIANLGELSDLKIQNIRLALEAGRKGHTVLLPSDPQAHARPNLKPLANLRYLDLALLLDIWNRWELNELLDELMPSHDSLIPSSSMISSLALQRCVEPTPKCEAPTWFEGTALPELLDVKPSHFNNTRIHRMLDELDAIGPSLMRRLPRLYEEHEAKFAALFIDVTDSWFVGHGPSMAEKAKTKEGRFERKINIVLLCNERGYPIRWEVLRGRAHDSEPILNIFKSIRGLSWVAEAPVVCDRAMGSTAYLQEMMATKLKFLTAVPRTEMGSYAPGIGSPALIDFEPAFGPEPTQKELEQAITHVSKLVQETSMTKAEDNLFFKDFGLVEPTKAKPPEDAKQKLDPTAKHKTVLAMELGQKLRADLDEGRATNYRGAGKPYGLSKEQVYRYIHLTALVEDLQEAILRGEAILLSENALLRIADLEEPDKQRAEFIRLVEQLTRHPDSHYSRTGKPRTKSKDTAKAPPPPLVVRAVLYFNPEMLIHQRLQARKALSQLEAFIVEQNRLLAAPQSRRKPDVIIADVLLELRKRELVSVYDVHIRERTVEGKHRHQVELQFKPELWRARRALDGFCLLVGHPDLSQSAADLCRLYRAKNAIEWNFRIIKSVVKLRPFHHRVDSKVRAHVTLCMLALLIERTFDGRLKAARSPLSTATVLNQLEGCRLNIYSNADNEPSFYVVNQTTPAQKAVLRVLQVEYLVDDAEISNRIAPR